MKMKSAAQLLAFATLFGVCALANVRVDYVGEMIKYAMRQQAPAKLPQAGLAGESVYARIEKAGTSVEAVFALPAGGKAVEAVYFPVFSAPGSSVAAVLERSRFYAHLDGVQMAEIAAVAAPKDAPRPPAGVQVIWFQFSASDQAAQQHTEGSVFRISYFQPHVAGAFYYLPQSLPSDSGAKRDWRFQIVIRSLISVIPAVDEQLEHDRLGDLVFVYPKDAQVIRVPVPKNAQPEVR